MLPRVAARLLGTPLVLARPKLEVILSVVGPRIGIAGSALAPAAPEPRVPTPLAVTPDGIAIVPVFGTLVKRVGPIEAASGLTSYGEIEAEFEAAAADPAVRAILLDVDSAGGEVAGVFDLADRIHAARGSKPVWALADEEALSGAYALASAAERVLVPRTGAVGSIGVIAVHVDRSARDAQEGLAYTTVFAGARKNDFSPHEPLADEARSALQAEVDRVHDLFATTVARNRGLGVDAVKATEARLFFGADAVAAGLADGVASFNEALAELRASLAARAAAVPKLPAATNHPPRKEMTMSDDSGKPAADAAPPKKEASPPEGGSETKAPPTPSPGPDEPTAAQLQARPAAPTADVIDLEKVRAEGYREAAAIAELCALAGVPERASEMIARNLTEEQARHELLSLRASAAGPEIHSHVGPSAGGVPGNDLESNPVVRAAKARTTKTMEA